MSDLEWKLKEILNSVAIENKKETLLIVKRQNAW